MDHHIPDLDDHDESVRIAVKALGDMRNGAARSDASRSLSSSSSSKSPVLSSPTMSSPQASSSSITENINVASTPPSSLVSRMSHIPLVESAIRAYEQGKASSRVVKFGAEIVESSVKSISRPVIDRLPVNQIDEFACRQLDKLDRYRSPSISVSERQSSPSIPDSFRGKLKLQTRFLDGSVEGDLTLSARDLNTRRSSRRHSGNHEKNVPSWLEATSPFIAPPPPPPLDIRSVTPTQANAHASQSHIGNEQQVAQRSRWQAVLLEAGGLSAAISEDSMRRLKYCLQWLQYATAHIDAQILILRDFIASLQPLPSESLIANRRPPISEEHMRRLTDVRRDVVHTIRQVVDVVSRYAGGTLPEPARNRVRGFILNLPQRWASNIGSSTGERERGGMITTGETIAAAATGTGAAVRRSQQRRAAQRERGAGAEGSFRSGASSRAASPSACSSPRISRMMLNGNGGGEGERERGNAVSEGSAMLAAQRILALSTESLDMMRNVTGVVKDSLDRADAWVGRLRTVGIQRGAQEEADTDGAYPGLDIHSSLLETDFSNHCHRRTISTHSSAPSVPDDAEMPASPFLSASSSTNQASSIPSTPGRSYSSGSFVSLQVNANSNAARSSDSNDAVPQNVQGEHESLPVGLRQMSLLGGGVHRDKVLTGAMSKTQERIDEALWDVDVGMDGDQRKMDVDV